MTISISLLVTLCVFYVGLDLTTAQPPEYSRYCQGKLFTLHINTRFPFYGALQEAQKNGQYLAIIRDMYENECLKELISQTPFKENRFWISANDIRNPFQYYWESTGAPVNWFNWGDGQPSHNTSPGGEVQHCVEVELHNNALTWNDGFCSTDHYSVWQNTPY